MNDRMQATMFKEGTEKIGVRGARISTVLIDLGTGKLFFLLSARRQHQKQ